MGRFPGDPVPDPKRRKPVKPAAVRSVSGYMVTKRPKGRGSRVVLSVLDRDGRLLHKVNLKLEEWKEFIKE